MARSALVKTIFIVCVWKVFPAFPAAGGNKKGKKNGECAGRRREKGRQRLYKPWGLWYDGTIDQGLKGGVFVDAKSFLAFLSQAERLKCNTRHCVTSTGRPESVAEHSWRTALMALLLAEEFPQFDINKVVAMCLVHDLGEAVTGDIPTFQKTQGDEAVEEKAVAELLLGLAPAPRARVRALFEEIARLDTPEARLFKALDRLEAVIAHNESPLSSWEPLEYDLNVTYGTREAAEFPPLAALREQVRLDTLEKIQKGE